ncbi:glycosyltransferase family 2 protein [Terriglobus roseus]|uniref:Glycosyltransferase involved in cell wall bisynthesis n=1 Tax=Terriglobus roseus TaxID=392734 RepID=A0A1G7NEH4_9BACT|nr:glycosyltransferase family 2 protein [Terriglobus roseus]SDF71690.1 Glycosyltransferase involved in cell wall bisynthesis [Terriglobus roseus]
MTLRATTEEPLVSIITVVFNAREELKALILSVLPLKTEEVELIVIDGGSQDGTVEYLNSVHEIDYWHSEPDRGIYDAMNKAIAHAQGTYLLHLNAGDRLLELPLNILRQARTNQLDILAFRVALDNGRNFQPTYGYGLTFSNTLHHQGTFFRRSVFPGYDDQYRIFADFDANQRMAIRGDKARIYNNVVAYHATDGVSNQNTVKAKEEFLKVIERNHGRKARLIAKCFGKWRGLRARLGI